MPIYEYKCQQCGGEFEVFQGISSPPVKSCKFCKGSVQKMMSLSSFHLKGNGWYATDYGGRKAPAAETKETPKTPEAPKSEPVSTTKAED